MRYYQARWLIGLLLCLVGLTLFAWGNWPVGKKVKALNIQPHEMQLALADHTQPGDMDTTERPTAELPAILEARQLRLETPRFLRIGDAAVVRMVFAIDPNGTIAPSDIDGLTNLYWTHDASVEASLELGGLVVEPSGAMIRPLASGQAASFEWNLLPDQAHTYAGTAWFYLRFVPKDGGESSRWPLAAQQIELPTLSLIGLSGRLARAAGGICILGGLIFLMDWIYRRLHRCLSTGVLISLG